MNNYTNTISSYSIQEIITKEMTRMGVMTDDNLAMIYNELKSKIDDITNREIDMEDKSNLIRQLISKTIGNIFVYNNELNDTLILRKNELDMDLYRNIDIINNIFGYNVDLTNIPHDITVHDIHKLFDHTATDGDFILEEYIGNTDNSKYNGDLFKRLKNIYHIKYSIISAIKRKENSLVLNNNRISFPLVSVVNHLKNKALHYSDFHSSGDMVTYFICGDVLLPNVDVIKNELELKDYGLCYISKNLITISNPIDIHESVETIRNTIIVHGEKISITT